MTGKRGAASWAVVDYLEVLVEQPGLIDLLYQPPDRLNIPGGIGNIGIFQVQPKAYPLGEPLPFLFVFPDGFFAFLIELGYAVFFYFLLGMDVELLFYLQFYRQPVRIPTRLPLHPKTLHGLVAADNILENPAQYVMDTRLSVGRRRAFIKHKVLQPLALPQTLFENPFFFPEFENLFFLFGKAYFHEIDTILYIKNII